MLGTADSSTRRGALAGGMRRRLALVRNLNHGLPTNGAKDRVAMIDGSVEFDFNPNLASKLLDRTSSMDRKKRIEREGHPVTMFDHEKIHKATMRPDAFVESRRLAFASS
jgi:hypothetical protein